MEKLKSEFLFILIIVLALIVVVAMTALKNQTAPYQRGTPDINDPNNCKPGYPCLVTENEGKIAVSNTPEVQELARKYGWPHVHIKALDIELVKDIEFIKQIEPTFKEQTGCIIIVHAGDEGYVYQEDKELNIIYQERLDEFMEKTKNVSSEIMSKFYLSLH